MADETLRFDIIGKDNASGAFSRVGASAKDMGGNMNVATRHALVLDEALKRQSTAARASADATLAGAKAAKILADAEGVLSGRTIEAELALKREAAAAKKSGDAAAEAAAKNRAFAASMKKVTDSALIAPSAKGSFLALMPALIPVAGGLAGAVGLVGASFGAAAVAAGGFGIVAKSVLASASSDSDKLLTVQTSRAAKLSQLQIQLGAATTGAQKKQIESQIATVKKASDLQTATIKAGWTQSYSNVVDSLTKIKATWKDTSRSIASPVLLPWLDAVNTGMGFLKPLIGPVATEFQTWGQAIDRYFKSKAGSTEIHSMAVSFGQFASLQLADIVSFIRDVGSGVHSLGHDLSADGVYFGTFGDYLARWGTEFATWSKSKQARADVQGFLGYMHQNGHLVVSIVRDLGNVLPGIFQGASATGQLELKAVGGLLSLIAKLPKGWQAGLTEAAGALLLLSKTGVLKVGFTVVGAAAGWVKKLIGGASVDLGAAGMQTAGDTMLTAAGAMQKAADTMVGADAAGGGGAAGGAGKAAGGGLLSRLLPSGLVAAAGYAAGGILIGGVIRGAGDAMAPKGTDAGKLNKTIQSAFSAIPGINIFSGFIAKSAPALGNFLTQSQKKTSDTFGAMGAVSSRYSGPANAAFKAVHDTASAQLDQTKAKTSQTYGAMGSVAGRLTGPFTQPFRTANQVGTQQFEKLQGNVKNSTGRMQASINALHGKTVKVGVTETGVGHFTIAQVSSLSRPGGKLAGPLGSAAGRLVTGGVPGRDSVLLAAMPGEVVVPTHMVKGGAVDHLRGMIPGFASGGYVGSPAGMLGSFTSAQESSFQAHVTSAMKSAMTAALRKSIRQAATFAGGLGKASLRQIEDWWMGAGGPGGGTAHVAAAITGAESGFNPRAVQAGQPYATTGWGLWQITPGNSEPQAGIDGQLLNGPANARAAVAKYRGAGGFSPWTTFMDGAYLRFMDRGGWLPPGPSLVYNGTGAREHLTPDGGGSGSGTQEALLAEIADTLASIDANTASAPHLTGRAVTDTLNGAARSSVYSSMYGSR